MFCCSLIFAISEVKKVEVGGSLVVVKKILRLKKI